MIITPEHMKKMKSNAIVGNMGHFNNKIDMNGLESFPGSKVEDIKLQMDHRTYFGPQQPFTGMNINGLHMTIHTGAITETITALGAKVR